MGASTAGRYEISRRHIADAHDYQRQTIDPGNCARYYQTQAGRRSDSTAQRNTGKQSGRAHRRSGAGTAGGRGG